MIRPYKPGEEFTGLKILGSVNPEERDASYHKYRAVWQCCGVEFVMSHKGVLDRVRAGRQWCKKCARKRGTAKCNPPRVGDLPKDTPYNVTLPLWAPTSAGLRGDRR